MSKKTYFIIISCFNIFCVSILIIIGSPISGLYAGPIVSMLFLFMKDNQIKAIGFAIIALLYLNLIILANNGIFYSGFVIPPLFGAESGVYEQYISRGVNLAGFEYIVKRPTGISDNLHVSGLLNLILCYWLAEKKRYFQFLIASIILFSAFNFQLTLVFIIWSYYYFNNRMINIKTFFSLFIGTFLTFFILDYLFLERGYSLLISNTIGDNFLVELKYYFENLTLERVLFGVKAGTVEDPYDILTNAIPVTDFGLLGVPLQNGVLGIISIFMIFIFWIKYCSNELKKFILINLIGLIHYFSMISFPAIVVMSWLVRYSMIATECKSPSSARQGCRIRYGTSQETRLT